MHYLKTFLKLWKITVKWSAVKRILFIYVTLIKWKFIFEINVLLKQWATRFPLKSKQIHIQILNSVGWHIFIKVNSATQHLKVLIQERFHDKINSSSCLHKLTLDDLIEHFHSQISFVQHTKNAKIRIDFSTRLHNS